MTPDDLGIRIRRARERLNMSQKQLADAVSRSVRAVGSWERGETVPRNAIGALEAVLGEDFSGTGGQADIYTEPDEARVWSWTDVTPERRRELIADLRALKRAARPAS